MLTAIWNVIDIFFLCLFKNRAYMYVGFKMWKLDLDLH